MTLILGSPRVQYFKTGTVEFLSGGKVYSYDAGTTTPRATYPTVDDALASTNANTNPVILDSQGGAAIVVKGATKIVIKDANDVTLYTFDDIDLATEDVIDENGNELLRFVTTADSVNEWTMTNAATSGRPKLQATGSDTNIGGNITSTGSLPLYLDGGSTGDLELNNTSTGTIRARRAVSCSSTLAVTGASTLTGAVTCSSNLTLANTSQFTFIPSGFIFWSASSSNPNSSIWLNCDGSAVSRTTYASLFTAIGTTFGVGDGSTTFNIPNLQRRVIVGSGGSGTGTLANTVGATGGAETHTLTRLEIPPLRAVVITNRNTTGGGSDTIVYKSGGSTDDTLINADGGSAHNNIQPSIVLYALIKI